jgi:hypothetical protein
VVSNKNSRKINPEQPKSKMNSSQEISKNGSSVQTKLDILRKKQKRKKIRFFIALALWIIALIAALFFISNRYM